MNRIRNLERSKCLLSKNPPKKAPAKTTSGRKPALPRATKTVVEKRKKIVSSSESSESECGL